MTTKRLRVLTTVAACGALLISSGQVFARQGQGRPEAGGKRDQFRAEIKAHHQQQQKENQAFKETLKGQTPQEACTALKTHMSKQFAENIAFRDQIYAKAVETIKGRAAEHEGGGDRVNDMLTKLEEKHTAAKTKAAEAQAKALQKLDELSQKEDLTWKELHEVMKAGRENLRERMKARRKEHRRDGQENHERGPAPVEL